MCVYVGFTVFGVSYLETFRNLYLFVDILCLVLCFIWVADADPEYTGNGLPVNYM